MDQSIGADAHSNRKRVRVSIHRRRVWLGFVVLMLMGIALAGLWVSQRREVSSPMVRGVLLDVEATSMIYAEQVTVRDNRGEIWVFDVSPEVMHDPEKRQSAAHLRQHMAAADPVRVFYVHTGDRPLA